ncbi:Fc.00g024040.m01.CDS01 [Cosmosporella sp. VM-42]
MRNDKPFKPALLVVDFQEDFCPPDGSLAVPSGRTIAPTINTLLTLPFTLKIATKDWHPQSHISFASNHPNAEPYTSSTTIAHPSDPSKSYTTTLWPVHCVQNTHGAELVPELNQELVDEVLEKGQNEKMEMYSAFWDPLRVVDSGLGRTLEGKGVTDVFVVGLAGDFCVKATAESALEEGYNTYIIREGTKPVYADKWEACQAEMEEKGIKMISFDSEDIARVKTLGTHK